MNYLALLPLLEQVIGKILPDPEQKESAIRKLRELDQDDVKQFYDFVVAYEGSGDKVHPLIQIIRGIVRPFLTFFFAGLFAYGFLNPKDFNLDQMQMLFQLNIVTLMFWFGSKSVETYLINKGKYESKARIKKLLGLSKDED